jgi:RHS repeat-associated protein
MRISGTNKEYYIKNSLGSTILLLDPNANIKERYSYSPFGSIDYQNGTSDNTKQFTGKEIDEESGLSYFGARYYNPEIGRWISRDPVSGGIAKPQSLNRYSYCLNNPLIYIDLWGLWENPIKRFNFAEKLLGKILTVVFKLSAGVNQTMSREGYIWRRPGQENQTYGAYDLGNSVTGRQEAHPGVDILGQEKYTSVRAAESGKVIAIYENQGDAGNMVVIQHEDGGVTYRTVYMHLDKISVGCGSVQEGQEIGTVGTTGNAKYISDNNGTGAHVHFELWQYNDKTKKWDKIDPGTKIDELKTQEKNIREGTPPIN